VKGTAIVAVVIIHASGATLQAPQSSANWSGGLILNQCADFAVPLFLAISGLFARYDGNSPLHFYAKRFQRLIGPYVLWSLIYIAITHTREFLLPLEVAEDILDGKGIGIGYFVPVLAQFVILTPLFARLRSEKMHFATMIVSGCLGLAYAYVVRLYLPNTMLGEFPGYAIFFLVWSPFYQLGFYLARYPQRVDALFRCRDILATAILVFLTLSIFEGFWLAGRGFVGLGASQIKLSSFGFSIALFLWLSARSTRWTSSVAWSALAWLGVNSYPIYLIHMLVLRGLVALLTEYTALNLTSLAMVPVIASAALAISRIVICAGRHLPRQGMREALAL
jgi:surface polysaccharide O-acyltransferase-like enzyme